jgi:hypothetical protein
MRTSAWRGITTYTLILIPGFILERGVLTNDGRSIDRSRSQAVAKGNLNYRSITPFGNGDTIVITSGPPSQNAYILHSFPCFHFINLLHFIFRGFQFRLPRLCFLEGSPDPINLTRASVLHNLASGPPPRVITHCLPPTTSGLRHNQFQNFVGAVKKE